MLAMVLDAPGRPLRSASVADPVPGPGQVLVRVRACAVCRTDLHVVDGELPNPKLPLIPGHEIVGEVVTCGPGPVPFAPGQRVGVPWLGHTCGISMPNSPSRMPPIVSPCPNATATSRRHPFSVPG